MKREGIMVMDDPLNPQGMSDLKWITDRLPTDDDADSDGDVLIPKEGPRSGGCIDWAHYTMVSPGQKWISGAKAEARADVFELNRRVQEGFI